MNEFPENLIKGRIVETIFQQMFLDTGKYNVYPFGYEQTLPPLTQRHHDPYVMKLMDEIRHTPDFVVTPKEKDGVYLVEVKYEHKLELQRVSELSKKLLSWWTCPWLFIATQDKFYFDNCSSIVETGEIKELDAENWVDREKQEYYSNLLRKFIKDY